MGEQPRPARTTALHPAILGLLELLPDRGRPWPERDEWIAGITLVVQILYPETGPAAELEAGDA